MNVIRYDCCWPRTSEDATKIATAVAPDALVDVQVPLEIALLAIHPRHWTPTADRWKSFGWRVTIHDKTGDA